MSIVNKKLLCFIVDIAAQKTRLASQGCIREKDFTFLSHGKYVDEGRKLVVDFAVKDTLYSIWT